MSLAADIHNLNLDVNNMGSWPVAVRGVVVLLACVGVLVAGYLGVVKPQLEQLVVVEEEELKLRKDFELKQAKASALDQYKKQMVEIEDSFGVLLRQLPSKTEVADLLSEVSSVGSVNGLNFNLFQPESERPLEFYAELPIQIEVNGEYHQFGRFVSDVAQLPRIVTLHDFTIAEFGSGGFMMKAEAKTYRYLDEDEIAAGGGAKRSSAGRKKR